MKVMFSLWMTIMLIAAVQSSYSQTSTAPKYVSMAFIKSKSPDFIRTEKEFWLPIHRQLIKDGGEAAWYLYRVKYPAGTNAGYDYIAFTVFTQWPQAEAPDATAETAMKKVHPNVNDQAIKKSTDLHEVVWKQLFQVIGEAADKIKTPSRFLNVNQMKTVPGSESEYVNLEITYFKPFHTERVSRGIMNNWSLYKPAFPYGEKYEFDYMTLNGFTAWDDITRNNPPDVWSKVHGNLNFDEIHSKILSKRATVNNELWELVAYVVEP